MLPENQTVYWHICTTRTLTHTHTPTPDALRRDGMEKGPEDVQEAGEGLSSLVTPIKNILTVRQGVTPKLQPSTALCAGFASPSPARMLPQVP